MPTRLRTMLCFALSISSAMYAPAQRIEPFSVYKIIHNPRYFRFHYDNDFFTATDKYYSQGITVEYSNARLKYFSPASLLITPYTSPATYGITFNLFGYTPSSIKSDSILYGDRPFDGNLSLMLYAVQPDSTHNQQFSSSLSAGVMGPAGLGKEIQTSIHRWTKNPLPHGWQFQIQNDIIINYQLNYDKKLAGNGESLLLNGTAEVRAGTLDNKISSGISMMAGKFKKRYMPVGLTPKKTECYFYAEGLVQFVGYNAALQGGLFNRKSPYTIPASAVTRTLFQANAGVVVNFKKLFFSYSQSYITKEFRTGKAHRWGGLSVGFAW